MPSPAADHETSRETASQAGLTIFAELQPVLSDGTSRTVNMNTSEEVNAILDLSLESFTVDEMSPGLSLTATYILPLFSEFSNSSHRRQLLQHFCTVLADLIIFHDGNQNPFVSFILPLAYSSEKVFSTLCTFTAAHLEYLGVSSGTNGSLYLHETNEEAKLDGRHGSDGPVCSLANQVLVLFYKAVSSPRYCPWTVKAILTIY